MGQLLCRCGKSSSLDISATRHDRHILLAPNCARTSSIINRWLLQIEALMDKREDFMAVQSQLEPITPCADISAHLAQLAHLYEASCPVLSNIYMLLAPLSPESLPGKIIQ